MSSNAQIAIRNKMSDGINPNPAFDMPLVTKPPVLTAGSVAFQPTDPIASLNSIKNTNGGVYSGNNDHLVRGVVAYTIPGAMSVLVIYFDTNKCRLDTIAPDVSINSDLVTATEKKNQRKVTGTLVIGRSVYKYTVTAETNPVGDTNQCIVTIVCAEN